MPTTTIGPPTTGSHLLDEIWKDAWGGIWKCTSAGTPGTWKQIRPAPVTADPSTGTIPTGYLIHHVTQGTLKRHAGSYDWHTVVGATGAKIGFYGVTAVVQPSGADQAAVTLGTRTAESLGSRSPIPRPRPMFRRCAISARSWPMTCGRCPPWFTPCGGGHV